jgi:BON domain
MSYDEEQTKRSRVVVETPTARREVVQQQSVRYPEERRGFSTAMVVTVALIAIAATAIIFLFLTNSRDDSSQTNVNIRAASTQPTPMTQTPVIVTQQPTTQPTPIIITQPAPVTTQPAPVVIQQAPPAATTAPPPATGSTGTTAGSAAAGHDDASLQQKLDKALGDDTDLSAAGVTATVINGRVTLTGMVNSDALKRKAERMAYAVKGVLGVDNHIAVSP